MTSNETRVTAGNSQHDEAVAVRRRRASSARLSRAISVGAVASTLLAFANPGCSRVCGIFSGNSASQSQVAHRTAGEPAYPGDALIEPGANASASSDSKPESEADLIASLPERGATPATHDNDAVINSTAPQWINEPQASAPAAKPVNVFGEFDGVQRGPVRAVGESGFQQHTFVDEGEDSDVTVDPAGKWLAFTSTRHNTNGDIYLQRVDGTSVTQLTNDPARDAFPAFSPDGKWLAFSSTRAGNWQIYRMDVDGREVVQVTSGPMQAIHPSFSPDGTRLVYSALGPRSGQWELWTVNLLTGERRQVGYGLFPSWSPDHAADRIAYQRPRQRGSRWFSLWTMELVNGEGRRNTEVAVSSNAAIVAPCWSPDGHKLAFTTVVQPTKTTTKAAGQQDVWTVDADGANKHRLTDGNGTNLQPAWAVDNRVYFVSNRGGNESIWSVRADTVDTFSASAGKATKSPAAEHAAEASADTKEVTH
jgi:TolB protein